MELTTKPYPFQTEGVDFLLKHNYCILGDEMGLGKSLQAIALMAAFPEARVLVLCPAYLKNNWESEIKTHSTERSIAVCKKKEDFKKIDKRITIMNYEQVKHLPREKFDLVVVDECQYLKSMKAQRTKAFHSFIKDTLPERLVLMSGTPIKNGVQEWYSLLLLCSYSPIKNNGIDIREKIASEWAFQNLFCLRNQMFIRGRTITKFYGFRNKEKLKPLLKGKYIRRLGKNVLDLPPMIRKNVLISFSKDKFLDKAWAEFNSGIKGLHVSTAKKESAIKKATFTVSYVKDLMENNSGPIVIFSEHPQAVQAIFLELQEKHRVRYIDGSVCSDDRGDIATMFQHGQLDFLVATIGAASTGLTLTKSNNLVFNDISWVPSDNAQAEKRIHRISQESTAYIHYMLGSVIDEMITKNLVKKQEVLREAL